MIQRIQSIFLLIATVLSAIMLFTPVSHIQSTTGETFTYFSYGFRNNDNTGNLISSALPVFILLSVITLMTILIIFLYKKRTLQMTLCKLTILLVVLFVGLICFNYIMIQKNHGSLSPSIFIIIIIPVLEILALIFALRGIHKDELIVKSYDRLR
jgi:hypothetical protein